MERIKEKAIRCLEGWILAFVMVVSGLTVSESIAKASDVYDAGMGASGSWVDSNLVTNGTFESGDFTGWTELVADNTSTESKWQVKSNSGATNNATNILNFYNGESTSNTMSVTQTILNVPAGTYHLELDYDGWENVSSGISVTISDGAELTVSKEVAATTGWDQWSKLVLDNVTLDAAKDLTITICGDVVTKYWGDFDNVVLYQWQEAAPVDKTALQNLVNSVPSDYASMGFKDITGLLIALDAANTCLNDNSATNDMITDCYNDLETTLNQLILVDSEVFIEKIASISDSSIRGMDISSYLSIMDAFDALNQRYGTTNYGFKDYNGNLLSRQGFFDFLADAGVNYVRVRVWNSPYDANGNGYGGGNNDLIKAKEMCLYATQAGMKVLIDFHYSDFWADPAKQQAPKAWKDKTIQEKATAIHDYTYSSIETLLQAGVNVTMVQVGNETNGAMCGVMAGSDAWTDNLDVLFDAGCDAVHEIGMDKGKDILAAVHFTNPEKSGKEAGYAQELANYDGDGDGIKEGVSYDVFATSYYPYWHGSLSNLSAVLSNIASTYQKYVMVAETSYANTLEDTDGHENTVRKGNNDSSSDCPWMFTNQGQVNEFRDVLATVTDIDVTLANGNKAGLGVFYWESAWIAIQNPYQNDGTSDAIKLAENKNLWETYGAGWASSYATEYDPVDAGKWFGGSSVDNQAFFGEDGNALSSLKVYNYNYLKYGAETTTKADGYSIDPITMEVGEDVATHLPATVMIIYNNGTQNSESVTWNSQIITQVNTLAATNNGIGTYTMEGNLISNPSYAVQCTVTVAPKNCISNYSFEDGITGWTISNTAGITGDDPKTGTSSCHFYDASAFEFTVSQEVTLTQAGIYNGNFVAQGDVNTTVYLEVLVDGTKVSCEPMALNGWCDWQKPSISNIKITPAMIAQGKNTVTFTIHVSGQAGSWGTIDDAYLYFYQKIPTPTPTATPISSSTSTVTSTPIITSTPTPAPKDEQKIQEVGTVQLTSNGKYKVTSSKPGAQEVEYIGPCSKKTTKVTIPEFVVIEGVEYPVTSISEKAFANNKNITKVTVGCNVEKIGSHAFMNCTKLKSVILPSSIRSIDNCAFARCTSLTKIVIPRNVTTIGSKVFYGDKNLKNIYILSNHLTMVGKKAFAGIKSNATIKVPDNCFDEYQQLLQNKGQGNAVTIIK